MTDRLAQLSEWMAADEDEHLEFKEAKGRFDFEELVRYCCALANEGGGHMILGVTDRKPRRVVGSRAFENLQRTQNGIVERLRLRIDAWKIDHHDGLVLVFEVPARPLGVPMQYEGAYWMRAGESLVPMTADMLKRIFDEARPDFSAEICREASPEDLDRNAVELFRARWINRTRSETLADLDCVELLENADLVLPGGVTYAALILLGTEQAIAKLLGQAELIFEYRADEASIPYQQRWEFRRGFLLFHDELWGLINARNEVHSIRDDMFRREIRSFNEEAVREAILNAVCHRDYRLYGPTFVRQTPRHLEVTSPGGFPPDVSPETVLYSQSPRNRRLADALARCGLVERSGQGADRMFKASIEEGKRPPDFDATGEAVTVVLHGIVQDEAFVAFLDRLSTEKQYRFSVKDLIALDAINREQDIPDAVRPRLAELLGQGAIERVGKSRLVLARSFYVMKGRPGEYTRRTGLDRETRKELIVKHIERAGGEGATFDEFAQVLPEATRNEIKVLLRELREAERAHARGIRRAARWYLGNAESGI